MGLKMYHFESRFQMIYLQGHIETATQWAVSVWTYTYKKKTNLDEGKRQREGKGSGPSSEILQLIRKIKIQKRVW